MLRAVRAMGGDYRKDEGDALPSPPKKLLGGTQTQASPTTIATFGKQKLVFFPFWLLY